MEVHTQAWRTEAQTMEGHHRDLEGKSTEDMELNIT